MIKPLAGFLIAHLLAFAGVLLIAPTASQASNCSNDLYDHNGSLMEVYFCDEGLNIAYDHPRATLGKYGIEQGTLLFEGSVAHSGLISGQAKVFKRGCGSASYPVSGRQAGDRIVLTGRAPVRASDCSIKRYRDDRLVFDLVPQ